jgi:hypothetical protein
MRKSSSRISSVMVGKANSSRLVILKMYAALHALFYTKKQGQWSYSTALLLCRFSLSKTFVGANDSK